MSRPDAPASTPPADSSAGSVLGRPDARRVQSRARRVQSRRSTRPVSTRLRVLRLLALQHPASDLTLRVSIHPSSRCLVRESAPGRSRHRLLSHHPLRCVRVARPWRRPAPSRGVAHRAQVPARHAAPESGSPGWHLRQAHRASRARRTPAARG